ncbi:MAG: hypothetical protein R3C15_04925 [Thermoleophilia bacterium]
MIAAAGLDALPLARSLGLDAFMWLGIPTLVYGGVLALGALAVGRRLGRGSALAFGLPSVLGVALIGLALALFAAIGAELVAGGDDPTSDAFVGWGRFVLVGAYVLSVALAMLLGRIVALRAHVSVARYVAAVATAVFFFVIVSAPFSSYVNACHVGDSILITADVSCR